MIKIPHHEFWPQYIMYSPVYLDYAINSLKMGTMKYPFVVNPLMELSGFLGEDKMAILKALPTHVVPQAHQISYQKPLKDQFTWQEGLVWVAKPNQGERGLGVRKIESLNELIMYHSQAPRDYILQEYINLPLEFGVFFVRTPDQPLGRITSLCLKDPITVTGDGERNVRELCEANPRLARQRERLEIIVSEGVWEMIPKPGEVCHLDVIRNHRRGSCFRDARHLITQEMQLAFQKILPESLGFNYGRIDVRAASVDEFKLGLHFKILEMNGVTSEPGEMYDPNMSLQESLRILKQHWKYVAQIGRAQLKKVERRPQTKEIYSMLKDAITRPAFFDK